MQDADLGKPQPGRPTKYTDEVIDRLCAALEEGLPQRSACIAAGIGVQTLSDWRDKDPTIQERMDAAQ